MIQKPKIFCFRITEELYDKLMDISSKIRYSQTDILTSLIDSLSVHHIEDDYYKCYLSGTWNDSWIKKIKKCGGLDREKTNKIQKNP